jgi:hypothetical protein
MGARSGGGNFNKLVKRSEAVAAIGPGLHFHDLRYVGDTLAARTTWRCRSCPELLASGWPGYAAVDRGLNWTARSTSRG